MIHLLKTFIILWRIFINAVGYVIMILKCSWLPNYDLLKFSVILGISLKHIIVFTKSLKKLLENNVTSSQAHVCWKSGNHSEVIWVWIFRFFMKGTMSPKCFLKIQFRSSICLSFRWLTKSVEIIKLHKRSFCCCNSFCLFISMLSLIWTCMKRLHFTQISWTY